MNTLITRGQIIDGSGNEPYIGDVLICGGVIEAVGKVPSTPENTAVIDADGRCVTPGFIDIHRHCDYAAFCADFGEIELAQGITTAVSGSCGLTPYPAAPNLEDTLIPVLGEKPFDILSFKDYKNALARTDLPLNIGAMIGSCAVRAAVKGMSNAPFSKAEAEAACQIVDEAMSEGTFGVSLGIMYLPEFYSSVDEMTQTAAPAARYGGILTAHIRGEGDSLTDSVEEAVSVAQTAGLPLQISHFKSCGPANWKVGLERAIGVVEKARRVHDVTLDAYPYNGGATTVLSLIPPDYPRSGWSDPKMLKSALDRSYKGWDNYVVSLGFDRILIGGVPMSEHPDPYAFLSEILENEGARAGITVMSMSQDDVDTVLSLPYAHVISDALYPADKSSAHPRLYSAFPKIIEDFVCGRHIMTLTQAVHKMTAQPAKRMGIKNRGLLLPGYAADVNVFAAENIRAMSDFTRGGILASGMDIVFVNGEIAWENAKIINKNGLFIERK